ncbi:MAG: hypothetical protein OES47_02530 [Acidobacteriota bacterium]|nr:hypothetical protein [Acidobacteriota bacterium]
MSPGDAPVLSFCRPAEPYVSIGFHRAIEEIDRKACRRLGLPILRRQIGGGPVYIDRDQLFFQITVPVDSAPARVDRLYRDYLSPAVRAFRRLGVDARLRGSNDIAVGNRRLSGTGAGRIGDAVTVVGNVIFRFEHRVMIEILALPSEAMRRECCRLMRTHVSTLGAEGADRTTFARAREELTRAYGEALGSVVQTESATEAEERAIAGWEETLSTSSWLWGPRSGRWFGPRGGRQVKICAGVWVFAAHRGDLGVQMSVVDGRLERVWIHGAELNGEAERLGGALEGALAEPAAVEKRLAPFCETGRRLAELVAPGLTLH